MGDELPISPWFVLARAVHFAGCLLLFGTFAFDRLVLAPAARDDRAELWRAWLTLARVMVAVAIPAMWISGAAWVAFVVIDMSGLPPRDALRADVIGMVWNQTQFGQLWKLRSILSLGAMLAAVPALRFGQPSRHRTLFVVLALLLSGATAGLLAWAGHGQTGDQVALHLTADLLHILVGGVWPMGLLPFGWMLLKLRRNAGPDRFRDVAALTSRFSTTALGSVALLTASGVVNSWLLVGPWPNLWQTQYGRVLLLKIALFLLMFGLGAINLKRLKPRLADAALSRRASARMLQNVMVELALGLALLGVVGWLGVLSPAADMGRMHHGTP